MADRLESFRGPLQARHGRHDGTAAQRLLDRAGELVGDGVIRSDDGVGAVPDLAVVVPGQDVGHGTVGCLTADHGLRAEHTGQHQRMPEPQPPVFDTDEPGLHGRVDSTWGAATGTERGCCGKNLLQIVGGVDGGGQEYVASGRRKLGDPAGEGALESRGQRRVVLGRTRGPDLRQLQQGQWVPAGLGQDAGPVAGGEGRGCEVQDLLTGLVGQAGELRGGRAWGRGTSVPEASSADHRHASGLRPTSHVGEDLVGLRIEPLDVVSDHDPGMTRPLQQSQGGFRDQEDAGPGPGLESEGGHQREPERLVQAGDVDEHGAQELLECRERQPRLASTPTAPRTTVPSLRAVGAEHLQQAGLADAGLSDHGQGRALALTPVQCSSQTYSSGRGR